MTTGATTSRETPSDATTSGTTSVASTAVTLPDAVATNGHAPQRRPAKLLRRVMLARHVMQWIGRNVGWAAAIFVVIAATFGVIFALITPPFWGHDEITQFGRTYQVAHGGMLPEKIVDPRDPHGVAYGGQIPASIDKLMKFALVDYNRTVGEADRMVADPATYHRLAAAPVSPDTQQMWFTNTAAYSPVAYLPAAAGMWVAHWWGLNVQGTLLVTRLAGLLAYLAIVGVALSTLRQYRVRWVAFTLALLPIAVYQAGTVTADTLTNALAILMSCVLVRGIFLRGTLSPAQRVATLATTVLLPLTKPTYVLLALLVVFIGSQEFGFTRWRRALPGVFAALGAVGFAVWTKIAAPTGDGMGLMRPQPEWHSVHPSAQLHAMLVGPKHFASAVLETVWLRDLRWFIEFFGQLGFAWVDVPACAIVACLVALVISSATAEPMVTTHKHTVVATLAVLASVAMILVTLYMSFTPVGYYDIEGVQGRYFVPLAVLGAAVVLRWVPLRLTHDGIPLQQRTVALTVVIATTLALVTSALKFQHLVWG